MMECSHQKRPDISPKNLWQGGLKGRGAVKGYLPIYTAKLEIAVGKANGLYHFVLKHQKIWAVICVDAIFLFFSVC